MNLGQKLINISQRQLPKFKLGVSLFFFFLLFGIADAAAQCDVIRALKEDEKTEMSLYFYPSTLRMVNLEQNEEFNRLIQDIKKLVFYKMNGSWNSSEFYDTINELMSDEDMEEYIVVDGPKQKLYVLGRENPTETVGLGMMDNEYYIFDVDGALSLNEIPKLYEYISKNDSTFNSAFLDVFDISKEFKRANRHH